ncbi:hypothetical protein SNE40_020229 [Patella caerulea]|uniref:Dual oxidase maturation factor 1 n=1 Tax=Patella caerulea TaxID=87958 RepID=A0AAN8J4L4_PATCE
MGLFSAFRENGAPTFYEPNKTPFKADLVESGLIFCIVILAFSFFVILPGIKGQEKLFTFIRIVVSLYIGSVILLTNFAQTWEVASTETTTKYKAGTGREINASITVDIGLRGINITLKGVPENQLNETINYNEHFSWQWRQGRLGFGPFAGRFSQEYRAAQFRGLPLPILWIAEYFTFDGEGIRWGRHYRQAGWYSHIALWLAFPLWILSNILFFVLLRYGAYFLVMTGISMVTSNILWSSIRNFNDPLIIPFTDEHKLEFVYGPSYFVCLITGVICMVLGIIVWILDLRFPAAIATFFNVDVLQDSEDIQVEDDDSPPVEETKEGSDEEEEPVETRNNGASAEPRPVTATDDEIYEIQMPKQKMRSERTFTQRFQKNRRNRPPPPLPTQTVEDDDDDQEPYINASEMKKLKKKNPVRLESVKMKVVG